MLTVQLSNWLASYTLFGAGGIDDQVEGYSPQTNHAAWAIAKIAKLIHPLAPSEHPDFKEEYLIAQAFLKIDRVKVGTLRQELEKLRVSTECIDFIEHLMVYDHTKRPSATDALDHPWLSGVS